MNKSEKNTELAILDLPPIVDVPSVKAIFGLGKTTAYALAASGAIQSLTMGSPGKRGKRMFLTSSILAYIQRRLIESKQLSCSLKKESNDDSAV